jgi:hypothetical protein
MFLPDYVCGCQLVYDVNMPFSSRTFQTVHLPLPENKDFQSWKDVSN